MLLGRLYADDQRHLHSSRGLVCRRSACLEGVPTRCTMGALNWTSAILT